MSNIFFVSDTHFCHAKSIEFGNRPFKDVTDMNDGLIDNWNSIVRPSDFVYHLGDFGFGSLEELRKIRYRLHGKIHLILGNHDFKNKIHRCTDWFTSVSVLKEININKQHITLCHYSMRVWNRSHYNSQHLFGHSHGKLEGQGKSFDVGVDCNSYRPISFEEVQEKMKTLPDNFNLVRQRR